MTIIAIFEGTAPVEVIALLARHRCIRLKGSFGDVSAIKSLAAPCMRMVDAMLILAGLVVAERGRKD